MTARPVMRGSCQLHLLQHPALMVLCLLQKATRAASTSSRLPPPYIFLYPTLFSQSGSASASGTTMPLFAAPARSDDDTVPADSGVAAAGQGSSPPRVARMLDVCKVGHGNERGGAGVAASLTPPPPLLLLLLLLLLQLLLLLLAALQASRCGTKRDNLKPAPPVELLREAAAEPAGTSTAAVPLLQVSSSRRSRCRLHLARPRRARLQEQATTSSA